MKNIFTIDTEDWFHANYEDNLFQNDKDVISTVEKNVDTYLEIFDRYNVKVTFFVLGFIAENHSKLVKKIYENGHEIASHGYAHQLVYKQTEKEFYSDVKKSKELLEDIIGDKVIGYRAPSWSIIDKSLWALDILEDVGFRYNSSIFPTKNFLYGIPYAPRFMHDCKIYNRPNNTIINIPPSTISIMKKLNVPFSGGFYFRALPYWFIKRCTDSVNKQSQPTIFYLHPREIDPKQPRLKLGAKEALIHYYGLNNCYKKLEKILSGYEYVTIRDFYKL